MSRAVRDSIAKGKQVKTGAALPSVSGTRHLWAIATLCLEAWQRLNMGPIINGGKSKPRFVAHSSYSYVTTSARALMLYGACISFVTGQ
jgi:hypothetical protein